MISGELIIALVFMALLFLRQISILKEPNKINYAPLMLGIGGISSVIHFILQPQNADLALVLKESFIPFLISLFLYIVMNILHQTQKTQTFIRHSEYMKLLIDEMAQLKEFAIELERKMIITQNQDKQAQDETRERFKHDLKSLEMIVANQNKFIEKFELMDRWHKDVSAAFKNFTEVQLPSLDGIVHRHIDIFRVTEQDHFNKVKSTLTKALENRVDVLEDVEQLKQNMQEIGNLSKDISNEIVLYISNEISEVVDSFHKQITFLNSHAQSIDTTLYESENRLERIKDNSEIIMRQMVLSSKKMSEIESQKSTLNEVYKNIKEVLEDIDAIKSEYVKTQSQLSSILRDFRNSKVDDANEIKEQIDILATKIENSLEKLQNHSASANEEISQNVKILARKSQIKNSYFDSESQNN